MRPQVVTVGPLLAANASALLSATSLVTGAVALTATAVDRARRIIFTSSGNDSTLVYTISGLDWAGNPRSETVSGLSAAAASTVLDYLSGITVSSSGASAGTVAIGTNGVAGSPWVRLDDWAPPAVAIQINVFGQVTATLQQTLDDPNSPTSPVTEAGVVWINSSDTAVVNLTASVQSNYAYAPAYARILLTGGLGSITATFAQLATPAR